MDKILKYKNKIYYFLNNLIPEGTPEFIRENFNFYIDDLTGGNVDDIWPVVTMKWRRKRKLGIIGVYDKKNKFLFTPINRSSPDVPLFKKGSNTAIYKINHIELGYNFIIRLYSDDNSTHMIDLPKIKDEYQKYKDNLIKVYYYGLIQTLDNKFFLFGDVINEDKDIKTYQFNHIITKVYNTPIFGSNGITNMNNLQKYKFILNNVKLLMKLELNNEFLGDYKLGNIGWDNNYSMDVILIDYDVNTIIKISSDLLKYGSVTELTFPTSYPPKYIGEGDMIGKYSTLFINNTDKFDKYSVGGLSQIISTLDLKFNKSLIDLPTHLQYNDIVLINTYALSFSLKLDSLYYDRVPSYTQIYNILVFLKDYLD